MHPHGQVLLVKPGLVGVAVAMGGYNRWAVMPNLLAALRSPSDLAQPHLIRLRTVLQLESLVLLGVLVAAAVLSTSEPPSAAP